MTKTHTYGVCTCMLTLLVMTRQASVASAQRLHPLTMLQYIHSFILNLVGNNITYQMNNFLGARYEYVSDTFHKS